MKKKKLEAKVAELNKKLEQLENSGNQQNKDIQTEIKNLRAQKNIAIDHIKKLTAKLEEVQNENKGLEEAFNSLTNITNPTKQSDSKSESVNTK